MSVIWVAEKLGKFIHEVEKLTPDEFAEYLAYFKLKLEEEKKLSKQAFDKQNRKGRPRR